jgi:post-segregation antitoxin (ccd killing protein)
MIITVSVPDQLAEQAAVQGLSVEAFVERLAHQAIQNEPAPQKRKRTPGEAVAHIRESRKGVTLGGLKIKDLIHEGHKY